MAIVQRPIIASVEYLRSCYITWLEIGGSHAHRFKGLVETLGLTTLIITDLDAKDPKTNTVEKPVLGKGLEARNETLRTWAPRASTLSDAWRASPWPSLTTADMQLAAISSS